jgi:hypothetical protein
VRLGEEWSENTRHDGMRRRRRRRRRRW